MKASSDIRERGLEWFSAALMLLWSFVLAQPGDTIAAPNFQEFLSRGITEAGMAWAFGVVGSVRLVALYINGRWPRTPLIRVVCAAIGAFMWTYVGALFGTSYLFYGIAGTGFAVYSLIGIAEFFSIYWAAFDVRYHRP